MKVYVIVGLLLIPFIGLSETSKLDSIPKAHATSKTPAKKPKQKAVVKAKPIQKKPVVAPEPAIVTTTRNMLGWDWMQQTPSGGLGSVVGSVVGSIVDISDPVNQFHFVKDRIVQLFGPDKITRLTFDSASYKDNIDYYVLDGLRTYLFNPGGNPIDKIWTHKGDGERKQYGDYLGIYHDDAFWKLSITATIDGRGANWSKCKAALNFIRDNNHAYITIAKACFATNDDVWAMFNLLYPQRHNMEACADFRGAYMTDRAGLVALVNSY